MQASRGKHEGGDSSRPLAIDVSVYVRASGASLQHWPRACLCRQLLERLREVISVVKQEDPSGALGQEKSHQRHVCLRRVTFAAGENEIVRPIVRRLAAAGSNMV